MIQNHSTSQNPNETLWLEVKRGQTRAPRRPVHSRRFLIGAGSNCQLQLGGDDVPILHSILLVDEDGAQIDTVVPSPELFVNGLPQRTAQLRDGDVLTIGKFEFAVHIQQPVDADTGVESAQQLSIPEASADGDLLNLSAEEIVDHLEQELREIAQMQSSRETGAEALLEAARRFGDEASDSGAASAEEAILLQLQKLSRNLQQSVDHALGCRSDAEPGQHPRLSLTNGEVASHRKAS